MTGTAIGECSGDPCLKVYVSDFPKAGRMVPSAVRGFPVIVEIGGGFHRL